MSHFKLFCKCGVLIAQCKCFSVDAEIRTTNECTHIVATSTRNTEQEPISIESLVEAKRECDLQDTANIMRCHPSVYNEIRAYFHKKEGDEMVTLFKKPATYDDLGMFGSVDIVIDKELEYGEYRFERRIYP